VGRRVRIRGVKVPVRRKDLSRRRHIGESFKAGKRRIEVADSLRGKRLLSTLVHEMLHQLDHRLSERTILRLEEGIVELVLENPEVFDRLWDS
jgi:hypothetical protein